MLHHVNDKSMKAEFLSPHDPYLEFDQVLAAAGEISDSEVVASVAVIVDSAPLARVDILASAGESCFRDVRSIDSMIYIGYGRFVFVVDVHLGYVRRRFRCSLCLGSGRGARSARLAAVARA